ncbi:MAG TPA: hypothetical protein VJX71_16650 [Methylomirabilota bacterium]|jgi:hypothetical protein|nr:hypothetical protein [Methylomirabilota bacterium]
MADLDAVDDALLLCYCTGLTVGELRESCRLDRWPPADKTQSGRLCTGCMGDLTHCLRALGASGAREPDEDADLGESRL